MQKIMLVRGDGDTSEVFRPKKTVLYSVNITVMHAQIMYLRKKYMYTNGRNDLPSQNLVVVFWWSVSFSESFIAIKHAHLCLRYDSYL